MEFYDVHEQTKYKIIVSRPESVEELSDLFITEEELQEIVGMQFWYRGNGKHTFVLDGVVTKEVKRLIEKLEASGRKTYPIEDEELLDVLREGYLTDFTDGDERFGRHGNRICYARRYKRVKKRATLGDLRNFWLSVYPHAFRVKYGCYPSHVPTYDRHLPMFKAAKKILGWKTVCKVCSGDTRKFLKQIWDNPEEFIK